MAQTKTIRSFDIPVEDIEQAFRIFEVTGKEISKPELKFHKEQVHRHNYYEICLFKSGSGIHEIDFTNYPIEPYSVHFISSGQIHQISRGENYHAFMILFSKEFYALSFQNSDLYIQFPFFNNYLTNPVLTLGKDTFDHFLNIIDEIQHERKTNSELSPEIIRALLHLLLLKCKKHFISKNKMDEPKVHSAYHMATRFVSLVESHFRVKHLVKEYSGLLALSPVNLNKKFKLITGQKASDFILERIILEAKRLLLYTDLTNKEIAFQLSYTDPSYFSRIFKTKTGMSPSDFKQKMRERYGA